MNTKVAIGLILAIIILVAAFFILNRKPAPAVFAPTTATTTGANSTTTSLGNTATSTHKPAITITPINIKPTGAFDKASLVNTTSRPFITGTANMTKVGLVITNGAGVGVTGSYDIPVVNGKWTFSGPQEIPPGTYTLALLVGGDIVNARLTMKAR